MLSSGAESRNFPAKLLLFGEHILLMGATAVSMPVARFMAEWAWEPRIPSEPNALLDFAGSEPVRAVLGSSHELFLNEVKQGLILQSNIPAGYGLGSSGSLCAAVYDRYVAHQESDFSLLKQRLAHLESHFHGASSGIDPLTSYLNQTLIIRNRTEVEVHAAPDWEEAPIVFLIDSGQKRASGHLIKWFSEQPEQDIAFGIMLRQEYIPSHEMMLQSWLDQDSTHFWGALNQFSHLQFAYCQPLIPESMRGLWRSSLDTQDFRLKICGAGGGGFLLGFCHSLETIHELSAQYDVILPF